MELDTTEQDVTKKRSTILNLVESLVKSSKSVMKKFYDEIIKTHALRQSTVELIQKSFARDKQKLIIEAAARRAQLRSVADLSNSK